jgi:hypothetical protein
LYYFYPHWIRAEINFLNEKLLSSIILHKMNIHMDINPKKAWYQLHSSVMLKINLRFDSALRIHRLLCFNGFQPSLLYSINPQREKQILILWITSRRKEFKSADQANVAGLVFYFTFVFKPLWNKYLTIEAIAWALSTAWKNSRHL